MSALCTTSGCEMSWQWRSTMLRVRHAFFVVFLQIILGHLAIHRHNPCCTCAHNRLRYTQLWLSSPPIQQCNIKLINRFPLKRHRVVHLKRKGNTSLVKCWQACTGPLFYLFKKKAVEIIQVTACASRSTTHTSSTTSPHKCLYTS